MVIHFLLVYYLPDILRKVILISHIGEVIRNLAITSCIEMCITVLCIGTKIRQAW